MGTQYAMKPLSVAYSDFIVSLTDVINESMLPPFIVESALKCMINDVHILAQNRLKIETEEYERQLSEDQKDPNNENNELQSTNE